LKIETQPLEDHQVKLTVEVEPESLDQAKQKAARQIARKIKIPGFRPGKAPYPVIVRQVGEEAILEEAIEILVSDIYPKIIDEAGIEPYGPGSLEKIISMEPPVLEFVVPLEAEVELGDYRSISRPYEPPAVSDEEVEKILNDLRERQALLEPVERAAEVGDMIYIRLSGERINPEEGKDAALIHERSLPVLIKPADEVDDREWPFPGFSHQLVGLSAGDEKTIEYTFSEDTVFDSLRGVEARFHVVVEDVKTRKLPELNDEFAASFGEYESLDEIRADIRKSLEENALEQYNESYDEAILEEAISQSTFKYPPQMVEREIENVINNLQMRLEQQGLSMDLYLKSRDMDMQALREEVRPTAESRLKRLLFLYDLAEKEKIEVKQEDLQAETIRTLEGLSQTLPEKEVRKLGTRNVFQNIVNSVMADLIAQKAIERLRAISSGTLTEETQSEEQAADESGTVEEAEASAESGEHSEVAEAAPQSGETEEAATSQVEPAVQEASQEAESESASEADAGPEPEPETGSVE
jgi:trigger factor